MDSDRPLQGAYLFPAERVGPDIFVLREWRTSRSTGKAMPEAERASSTHAQPICPRLANCITSKGPGKGQPVRIPKHSRRPCQFTELTLRRSSAPILPLHIFLQACLEMSPYGFWTLLAWGKMRISRVAMLLGSVSRA